MNGGAPIRELPKHAHAVTSVGFADSGARFATADARGATQVFDTLSLQRVRALQAPAPMGGKMANILTVSFNRADSQILTAAVDGTARLWDIASGELVHTFRLGDLATYARFEFNDEVAITAGWDNVRLWDVKSGAKIMEFDHPQAVAAWYSPEHELLFTTAYQGTTKAWEVRMEERSPAALRALLREERGGTASPGKAVPGK